MGCIHNSLNLQTFNKAGKACQGQTLQLITNIDTLQPGQGLCYCQNEIENFG